MYIHNCKANYIPFSSENFISILVTDYVQKRRGQAILFSFEYNMLPNLISNFNHYMDRAYIRAIHRKIVSLPLSQRPMNKLQKIQASKCFPTSARKND